MRPESLYRSVLTQPPCRLVFTQPPCGPVLTPPPSHRIHRLLLCAAVLSAAAAASPPPPGPRVLPRGDLAVVLTLPDSNGAADSTAAAIDTTAAAIDTTAAAIDTTAAAIDTTAAAIDSTIAAPTPADADSTAASVDSVGAAPSALRWWSGEWLLTQLGPSAGEPAAGRAQLFNSASALFSQVLQRHTRLDLHEAGSPLAWDLPYDLGPGVDRLSLWLDGLPTAGAALAEAHCLTVSPLLLGDVRYLAPDPFLDPLGASGDGMIWTSAQVPAWEEVPSMVRFTEGVGQSSTEDVIAGRQLGRYRALASYAHSNTRGRQYYPNGIQRYRDARFQNLYFQADGAWAPVAARATVADRAGRYTLYDQRKLVWEASQVTAGAQLPWNEDEGAQIRVTRRTDRLQWWGAGGSARRRTHSLDAIAQAGMRLGMARLLLAAGSERVRVSLSTQQAADSAWTAYGLGIATGVSMEAGGRALAASVAWTDPWWTRGHARGRIWFAQELSAVTDLRLEGWTGRAGIFIPRLEPDGDALVREGLHLIGRGSDRDGPVRRLAHLELAARWRPGGAELGCAAYGRRIGDGLGSDPDEAATLLPGARTAGSLADGLGEVTLVGGRFELRVPIRWGFRLEGTTTVVLDPPPDRLPVLVAPYHGHGGLFVSRSACQGDLGLELGLIALWQGQWESPRGAVPARLQFDAEGHLVFLSRADIFLRFRNLTDEYFESATYDEAWGALPYRSSTVGLEWHFLD